MEPTHREIEEAEEIEEIVCAPMRRGRFEMFIRRRTPGVTMNLLDLPLEFPRLRRRFSAIDVPTALNS